MWQSFMMDILLTLLTTWLTESRNRLEWWPHGLPSDDEEDTQIQVKNESLELEKPAPALNANKVVVMKQLNVILALFPVSQQLQELFFTLYRNIP